MLYQLEENREQEICAGAKAPADVSKILRRLGAVSINLHRKSANNRIARVYSQVSWILSGLRNAMRIKTGSAVFLQYPRIFLWSKLGMRYIEWLVHVRKVKLITLIHDINELRGVANKDDWNDLWKIVNISSIIIVHNTNMRNWYLSKCVPSDKIIELEIFDYLSDSFTPKKSIDFVPCITLASNLISTWGRGGFLTQLKEISDVQFELYGPNYDAAALDGQNIHYNGCFAPEEALDKLVNGFGLIWGGDSIDSCSGAWGEYFRYISPHRLSAYLAAGLPVIVWDESGQADFVRRNKVGIVIKSLRNAASVINAVTKDEYMQYRLNALRVSEKLRNGYYLKSAIAEALRRLSS